MITTAKIGALSVSAALAVSGCAGTSEPFTPRAKPTAAFPNLAYANWTDAEPPYRFYPGDELEITVPSAPELNKTVIVQPDGRISLPLITPVMAADRTTLEVQAALSASYAEQLVHPDVSVNARTTVPLKVFVGGAVEKPGLYDMPGAIDALQAVIQAGGFSETARRGQVVIIRRGPEGQAMMRTADLRRGLTDPAGVDAVPLRRFDIVYVPRTTIAEAGLFVQQLRNVLPFSFGFSYALNGYSGF